MKLSKGILFAMLSSFVMAGCADKWKTFEEGTYKGEKYEVQSREVKGFTANHIEHRFRLGKMKYIEVGALTTDWGPPYTTDIYGADAFEYISGVDTVYQNLERLLPRRVTFLYFSKSRFSEQDYEDYAAFMRAEWIKIDKEIHSESYTLFPSIIGIVYGSPENFTRTFKGTYMGDETTFVVENDGRVRLLSKSGEYGHNMSRKVQMPGKRILMDTTYRDINIDLLKTFKNYDGVDPTQFFEFVPVASVPGLTNNTQ